ncbi:CHAT domain-containing protein [Moorena producens JHB]|uniref:CHAT domain-containing protein n=4 Tax=Moorena TaxID=1155738 RepID=A0A1D9FUJ6_MOOP1|nr:CHAT domain-containing protein [Moorena producens]AOY79058.1 CHAT domain-containing protein [Moorena producens JHB]
MSSKPKSRSDRFLGILFLFSLTVCIGLGHLPSIAQPAEQGNMATTQADNPSQLVEQGVEYYQAGDYQAAIEPWENALKLYQQTNNYTNSAIVRENLARAYQKIGHIQEAISNWEQAILDYQQLRNWQQMGRMKTELAQAYNSFGQPRKAIALLCGAPDTDENSKNKPSCVKDSALKVARAHQDWKGEAAALGSLGNAYLLRGDYDQGIECLQTGLGIDQNVEFDISPRRTKDCKIDTLGKNYTAKIIADSPYRSSFLNDLGNAYFSKAQRWERWASSAKERSAKDTENQFRKNAKDNYNQARDYFKESLELARTQNHQPAQMRALRNLIRLSYRPQESISIEAAEARNQWVQDAQELFKELPDSQDKVYAAIDLAKLEQPMTVVTDTSQHNSCGKRQLEAETETLLNQAISIAQRLQDYRSQSFALGELGHLYYCRQDYQNALDFTQKAWWMADQNLSAKDSLYLWQWQLGQIFQAQGNEVKAVNAYKEAIATLNDIRKELLIAERDLQFDFRDAINPLHRELAKLRLERAELLPKDSKEYPDELKSALETIDSLKLAELQNYFGNDCALILISQKRVDELVGEKTAVFSSIILSDRTGILVSLPKGEKRLEWINVDSQTLREEINQFRRGLERRRDINYNLKPAQELYKKIIAPFTKYLKSAQIETLVFIQDGILRSIPMAALHDGEKFLVETYAIATTPSLKLTNPQALNRQKLRVLALGLTQESEVNGQGFSALTNVESELKAVETQFPGSKTLLNQDFTQERLEEELAQTVYPILHIATHGQFSAIREDTFLVTGNNDKLTLDDLENTISGVSRKPDSGELLALTACQTAVGDDRAALGLAGIAVRAGVSSALASLWSVNDASTAQLVTEFYANLRRPGVSKAEALRAAQRKLIEAEDTEEINDQYAHPAYWAPFILIGNWL